MIPSQQSIGITNSEAITVANHKAGTKIVESCTPPSKRIHPRWVSCDTRVSVDCTNQIPNGCDLRVDEHNLVVITGVTCVLPLVFLGRSVDVKLDEVDRDFHRGGCDSVTVDVLSRYALHLAER